MESGSNLGSPYILTRKTFKIWKLIAILSSELAPEIPNHLVNIFATSNLSRGLIAHVTEYAHELQTLKDVRIDQITRMGTELTRLWYLLTVGEDARQEFLRAHSTLSAAVVESCAKEIEHLVGLRAQRFPVLIREQDVRIEWLLSTLHVIRPRVEHGDDFQATSDRNEEEPKYLTELHREMESFREPIGQREEMLLELHEAKAAPGKKPNRKDEQRKCRMRALLLRIEKKLYLMLVEFREVNDSDLK
jgi:hypothetical protein